jgi:hypothetical protein
MRVSVSGDGGKPVGRARSYSRACESIGDKAMCNRQRRLDGPATTFPDDRAANAPPLVAALPKQ